MRKTQVDTKGETETFLSRNVRLITFLVCIALFLAVFGPLSVFHISKYIEQQSDTRVEMTKEDLLAVSQRLPNLSPQDLSGFVGECGYNQVADMKYEIYQIYVEGRYLLMASFNQQTAHLFYLNLTDMKTGEKLDLLKEAPKLEQFLQSGDANGKGIPKA